MKIKRVSCEQFAGIVDREYEFEDGLNIVVGDNESGKSTMVDLIYHTLFQDAKLDKRSASDYISKYFPRTSKGDQLDDIDGEIVFEVAGKTYKLQKEWGKSESSCKLIMPDRTVTKNAAEIKAVIQQALAANEGIYNEIVFASQKRGRLAGEVILSALAKGDNDKRATRDSLAEVLKQAKLETGGVSIKKAEDAIEEKLKMLRGRWDFGSNTPEGGAKRGIQNKWDKGFDKNESILAAWYAMEEIRKAQKDAAAAEERVDVLNAKKKALVGEKESAEATREAFQAVRSQLKQCRLLEEAKSSLSTTIDNAEAAKKNWPKCIRDIKAAEALKEKLPFADARRLYMAAKPYWDAYCAAKNSLDKLTCVEAGDLKQIQKLVKELHRAEDKLSDMNITVRVKMLSDASVAINSMSSGAEVFGIDGVYQISEAAQICVPGVMEMQLTPANIDADAVKSQIAKLQSDIAEICNKYAAANAEKLEQMKADYEEAANAVEKLNRELIRILQGKSWEAVEQANDKAPADLEDDDTLIAQQAEICGVRPIDIAIGSLQKSIEEYEKFYGSLEKLAEVLQAWKKKLNDTERELGKLADIPSEYKDVNDPDEYEAKLKKAVQELAGKIEALQHDLDDANRALSDKSAEEYGDELEQKIAVFEARKTAYSHWLHISEAFNAVKARTDVTSSAGLERSFREYLDALSYGGITLQSMSKEMSAQITSKEHALNYDILSEGTKDTIALAFRLAMLEQIFPDGDGLAVFDDPFTDMDPTRTAAACRLLQKFAEKNQVIFITCDDKYTKLLDGHVISA